MSGEIKEASTIKIYRNSDILRIVALIPPCHKHLRLAIFTKDQVIILHEATVAAIVRAYIDITTHPTRKAVEYNQTKLGKDERKQGYAEYQLIESGAVDDEVIKKWENALKLNCDSSKE